MILARIGYGWVWLALGIVLSLGATVPSRAGQESGGWKQLNLRETTLAGTKLYYEQSLEPNLPALEHSLTKLAEGRDRLATIVDKHEEIIADINRILGVSDPNVKEQSRAFVGMSKVFSQTKLTFYFVTKATIKEFLRSGGRLPDVEYDPQSDTAIYRPRLAVPPGAKPPETWELCIPAMPDGELQDFVLRGLDQWLGAGTADLAIHEITELTLLRRAHPTDPYWRWFSDGFANAITLALVERHIGPEERARYAAAFDPGQYAHLEKEINLRYWMLVNFGIHVDPMPVETEAEMEHARYAYATLEARRIIDRHGLECVRRILDAASAGNSRGGNDLLEVIKTVIGEDIQERLNRYQTFETQSEGISKYADAYQEASKTKDLERMFVAGLRIMELRGDAGSPGYLQCFESNARLLAMMGHEEAGDEAMRSAIDLYSRGPGKEGRLLATEAFVVYALQGNNPRKAAAAAEELLANRPQNVWALTVKMLLALEDRNTEQAQEYARQIRGLAPAQSPPYRIAEKVLAVDPNTPTGYKGPSEQK